ncbi:serine/threonine-protein kinase [Streptomyces sp. NPDC056500]|uniref:serine/threonine-protein kinase n=1 Tax=Streptomyces sp. NPDC056500 TaxID=3345840 RepID=UPI0036901088
MTNNRGRGNEPTSYDLRPPHAPQIPTHVPPSTPPEHHSAAQSLSATPPAPAAVPVPPPVGGPEQGRRIGGRYRLVSRLGHGGMGTVWRAHDEVVDREVAVKEPRVPDHLNAAEREKVYLRMQREARAAARIEHPAVVTMHDVVVEDGKPWIVMELVHGQSLADRLQEGTLDVREAARIGLDVLGALAAAHEAGVLHRDVKPDNVLLGRGDRVVLTDFGIAQIEGEQGLTETGAFVGSPEFIAPERVLGQRPGPESDLWSLGVVLYAAVEGVSPYRRSHIPATLQAVLSAEPQTPSRGSGALGTLVMQLLRKDPAMRPDAAEIRQTLEGVARPPQVAYDPTQSIPGHAPGPTGGGNRWVPPVLQQSKGARYGLGGGLLAVAVALTLVLVDPFGGTDGQMPEGWEVRSDREVVAANMAVPSEYKRVEEDRGASVTYYDPSGVFLIYLERVETAEVEKELPPSQSAWRTHYERGGDNGTEIDEPKVTIAATEQQGKKAFDTTVDFLPPNAYGDNPARMRWQERIVATGEGAKEVYWRLRVSGPAEGWAAKEGSALFERVVEHLDIQEL